MVENLYWTPRQAAGVEAYKAAFGEGNLGLVTKAVIQDHKLQEAKRYGSVIFADWKIEVAFMAALSQTGAKPASIRLVDNVQFRLGQALKPAPTDRGKILTSKVESSSSPRSRASTPTRWWPRRWCWRAARPRSTTSTRSSPTPRRSSAASPRPVNGERGYMLTYAIAYIRDLLSDYYIVGETYETTVPWSRIHDVCDAVKRVTRMPSTSGSVSPASRSPRRG